MLLQPVRLALALQADGGKVRLAAFAEGHDLDGLSAFEQCDLEQVIAFKGEDGRAAAAHDVALDAAGRARLAPAR